jgi:hypothetical protein
VKKFGSNSDVVFGDVNLSEDQVRDINGEPQNPGQGGWPTLRYFNKETGYGGAKYVQKTGKRICEEMKDPDMVEAWVQEQGKTSLCSIADGNPGCSEREVGYITKAAGKSAEDRTKQLRRLSGMADKKMAPKAKDWVSQRIAILKQMVSADGGEAEL